MGTESTAVINRVKPMFFRLWVIFYASSAVSQEVFRNCQCFLSCEGASELKKHDRVRVLMSCSLEDDEKIQNVSSLYKGERCLVPGCFQKDTQYRLQIYAYDKEVPDVLINKEDLQPECDPEGISDKNLNSAEENLSSTFLPLLIVCFWIIFHLEGPG